VLTCDDVAGNQAWRCYLLELAKKTLPKVRGRPESWRRRPWGSLRINHTILIISVAPIIGISPSGLDIGTWRNPSRDAT